MSTNNSFVERLRYKRDIATRHLKGKVPKYFLEEKIFIWHSTTDYLTVGYKPSLSEKEKQKNKKIEEMEERIIVYLENNKNKRPPRSAAPGAPSWPTRYDESDGD